MPNGVNANVPQQIRKEVGISMGSQWTETVTRAAKKHQGNEWMKVGMHMRCQHELHHQFQLLIALESLLGAIQQQKPSRKVTKLQDQLKHIRRDQIRIFNKLFITRREQIMRGVMLTLKVLVVLALSATLLTTIKKKQQTALKRSDQEEKKN